MKQYHELLQTILNKGSYKEPAREGMPGTTSLFGHQSRYNLQDGFPILTTKKVNFKSIVIELLWFLKGDINIKYLVDNGCNIWNEDAYNYYIKLCKKEGQLNNLDFSQFIGIIKEGEIIKHGNGSYNLGDCGFQYGKVWRKWDNYIEANDHYCFKDNHFKNDTNIDQLDKVIKNIKSKPYDRRKVVTAIDPAHDEDLALYWCHCLFQFNCRKLSEKDRVYWAINNSRMHRNEFMFPDEIKDRTLKEQLDDHKIPEYYLDCQLYQRSCDVFLGVPYNISSYALLTHIVAELCNMVPGEFIHTYGDVHIYDNHMEQVKEQLIRDYNKYTLPKLKIVDGFRENYEANGFDSFTKDLSLSDFDLIGYESYSSIKGELSTGLKK